MTAQDALVEYRFLGYRLDARQRKLFKPEGDAVPLSSRAFDALLVLVERHGETLSKAHIMQAVWPNAVVEENNLNQAISSLRKAFGDNKSDSNFILTVPGRGYCFIAPVEAVPLPAPGHPDHLPHSDAGARPVVRQSCFEGGWWGPRAQAPFAVAPEGARQPQRSRPSINAPALRPASVSRRTRATPPALREVVARKLFCLVAVYGVGRTSGRAASLPACAGD